MHTINLEQPATVVSSELRDGERWAVPDVMIGTDSHTPMVNGLGVLGWGVGGLEAQAVMFGMPTVLRIPEVVGVRLTGRLAAGVLATDLALTVTQRLRAIGVAPASSSSSSAPACPRWLQPNVAWWPTWPRSTGRLPATSRSTTRRWLACARPGATSRTSRWSGPKPRQPVCGRIRPASRATRA